MLRNTPEVTTKLILFATPLLRVLTFNWLCRRNYSTDSTVLKFFGGRDLLVLFLGLNFEHECGSNYNRTGEPKAEWLIWCPFSRILNRR